MNTVVAASLAGLGLALGLLVPGAPAAPAAAPAPVSYYREVLPILKRSCTGCHHPGKLKGELDVTTHAALRKGGKHGPGFVPGDPVKSLLIDEISGAEPSMPKEGDPLSRSEVELLTRWVAAGAPDDTPADAASLKPKAAPVYRQAPAVSAMALSPDGRRLAVSGYHEVLIHSADGSNILARLLGESPRIESIAWSPDGRRLAVAGGAPARFGELQIWDVSTPTNAVPLNAWKIGLDSLYGVSWAPEGDRVAFGSAEKVVRIWSVKEGRELVRFDNHSDWIFATAWTLDGKKILSGSRDRAMKLIDASSGQFIDDINKLMEGLTTFSRHPTADQVAYAGEQGTTRVYKISDNQNRTAANNDVNLVKEIERLPGAVQAVAYNPDGNLLAIGGASPEVRVYQAREGRRVATLKGHDGAVFALAWQPPATNILAVSGYDGRIRIYDVTARSNQLLRTLAPVPLAPAQTARR